MYRQLDKEDLVRMGIPLRFWNSTVEKIPDDDVGSLSTKTAIINYMKNLEKMREAGVGLILWGDYGVGKTSASVVVAKEFRRCGHTVLFLDAASLKRHVISREQFDEDESYFDRIHSVDLLIINDFGKGINDTKGYGAALFDEIMRDRSSKKKITFISSNLQPERWANAYEDDGLGLKKATMDILRECMIPVRVQGDSQRGEGLEKVKDLLFSSC